MEREVVATEQYPEILAEELASLIGAAVDRKGSCSIALAGGSTPGAIYRAMTKAPLADEIPWHAVTLYFGDERWVPKVSPQSNYHMVEETLIRPLGNRLPTIVHVNFDASSAAQAAQEYEQRITQQIPQASFDIILLGLGEDGHFASLFPHSPLLTEEVKLVVPAVHPSGQERISFSVGLIQKAQKILFLVTGERKASVVKRLFEGNDRREELPARVFFEHPERFPQVRWFLDTQSAARLS